jgi:hypothetical protein
MPKLPVWHEQAVLRTCRPALVVSVYAVAPSQRTDPLPRITSILSAVNGNQQVGYPVSFIHLQAIQRTAWFAAAVV